MEIPRNKTNLVAGSLKAVVDDGGFKKIVLGRPKFFLHELFELVSLRFEISREIRFSGEASDLADGPGVAIHIAVDGGAPILVFARAANGFLHPILHVMLPKQSIILPTLAFPPAIVRHKIIQDSDNEV